eukprot:GFUD01044007.1.p1 GENE.GFUD01044007.1~~GFUD01044007.1.p1  ORF type:complete len:302 (-),score=59.61 GFUD01044007.1:257-1162(-)
MILMLFLAFSLSLVSASEVESTKDHHFDVLILTQHWPYTTCIDWEESGSTHKCREITHANWTVHGLWPTQWGKIAPGFCNNSWKFDHDLLKPIMTDMSLYWPDVEMRDQPDSLWTHEWTKHGTCAAQLPETNSEVAYFSKGCELAQENRITDWLETAGVVPSNDATYSLEDVWDAVMKGTGGMRPHIDCVKIDGQVFISEIKVCYSKNFSRVNCDGIKSGVGGHMMGKCLRYGRFSYPSSADSFSYLYSADHEGSEPHLLSNSGMIGGIVCTVLALSAVGLAVGYMLFRRSRRRGRGYESL